LRDIMKSDKPFGGKVFVVGGDFRQTLPIVQHGNKVEIIESCVKSSPLWRHFKMLSLSVNMRSEDQQHHNEWLLKIGEGNTPILKACDEPNMIEVPEPMIEHGNLIDSIFGENPGELTEHELSSRVILAATNAQCLEINFEIIRRMKSAMQIYNSVDSIISEDANDELNYPPEFLHKQTPSGMPPHVLLLRKGTVIMLLRNLNPKEGLCNGTRLIVEQMTRNLITSRIISECNFGDIVVIPRIILTQTDSNLPFVLKRRQFPVIPAFCVTLNKSQGQSYETVGLDLQVPVFGHGQLYVGFSRSKQSQKIKVKLERNKFTKNIVYKEVFKM